MRRVSEYKCFLSQAGLADYFRSLYRVSPTAVGLEDANLVQNPKVQNPDKSQLCEYCLHLFLDAIQLSWSRPVVFPGSTTSTIVPSLWPRNTSVSLNLLHSHLFMYQKIEVTGARHKANPFLYGYHLSHPYEESSRSLTLVGLP